MTIKRWLFLGMAVGIVASGSAALAFFTLGQSIIRPQMNGQRWVSSDFPHRLWDRLLQRHVKEDGVDYESWKRSRRSLAELDRYLALVARYSPDSHPLRFLLRQQRLAYWLHDRQGGTLQVILTGPADGAAGKVQRAHVK